MSSHLLESPFIGEVASALVQLGEPAAPPAPPAPKKTKQDYGTPWSFIAAVEERFGTIVCDLAAHAGNAKCTTFITPEEDTFTVAWAQRFPTGVLWLNPEFANIAPYAEKCFEESKTRHGLILLLTPASIGTQWYANHVKGKAFTLGLEQRLPFEGMPVNVKTGKVDGYPKDLMLSVFGYGMHGHDTWSWAR